MLDKQYSCLINSKGLRQKLKTKLPKAKLRTILLANAETEFQSPHLSFVFQLHERR